MGGEFKLKSVALAAWCRIFCMDMGVQPGCWLRVGEASALGLRVLSEELSGWYGFR